MEQQALGLIETMGMTGAVEATDVCLKSANVQLVGYELASGGLVIVKIQGSVGAVKSSIDAARVSASKVGQVIGTSVIPRPAKGISLMIGSGIGTGGTGESGREDVVSPLAAEPEEANQADGGDEAEAGEEPALQDPVAEDELTPYEAMAEGQSEEDGNEAMAEGDGAEEKENSCNLCGDPLCHRQKGQPRNWCIHYGEKDGSGRMEV